jgi:hypothetical protein
VAIIIAFLLAAFGSSRRWSNRWIVQKGLFAAHALSLSLGTYSIGLMQTSPVKSEMYPIWTVSLFTLFGCIDPVTANNGLDYKGPLSKSLFGTCLNCGYVLLMSNSAIFSDTGNTAINVLATITFMKSFHRSLALVQQSRMRKRVQDLEGLYDGDGCGLINNREYMVVDFTPIFPDNRRRPRYPDKKGKRYAIFIKHVEDGLSGHKNELWYQSCYDACVAFALSHKLQWHFLGLGHPLWPHPDFGIHNNCTWALKVIEIELAFLYDIFFTGYPFLHYYQAKTASLWALASFAGICFVGVAIVTPGSGTVTSHRTTVSPGGCTNIVDTTALDLVFTFGILVSIALLQLMHLIQGWTSIWARCSVAWAYGMNLRFNHTRPFWWQWWMRRKASVATSINKYLWQEKIGQCSILTREKGGKRRRRILCGYINCIVYQLYLWLFAPLIKMLGVHYVWEVVRDLLGNDTNKGATVRLDNDVKESIVQFLGDIVTNILEGKWLHLPDEHPLFRFHLLYFHDSPLNNKGRLTTLKHGGRYTSCVTTWHTATWYCEQVEREREEQEETGERETNQDRSRNRRVANILSKYCIYLVVSAPELLPGLATETTFAMDSFAKEVMAYRDYRNYSIHNPTFNWGMDIAKRLLSDDPRLPDVTRRSDPWETLAVVWVRLLLYAAPYGDGDAHMRHLAQGGEFITHLCALLYHLGIHEWKLPEVNDLHNISTIEEAQRILAEDEDDLDIIVVAFFATPDVRTLSSLFFALLSSSVMPLPQIYTTFFILFANFLITFPLRLSNPVISLVTMMVV